MAYLGIFNLNGKYLKNLWPSWFGSVSEIDLSEFNSSVCTVINFIFEFSSSQIGGCVNDEVAVSIASCTY